MALNRIERKWDRNEEKISPFFLDLIAFREVSHFIAQHSGVQHESPQVIVVKNGEVVHHASHNGISLEEIMESIG